MPSYTKGHTLTTFVNDFIRDVNTLYNSKPINWTGKTNDTKERYTEVVSDKLIELYDLFRPTCITRKNTYNLISDHIVKALSASNIEDAVCKAMFLSSYKSGKEYNIIKKIIDFQTPIRTQQGDSYDAFDLLSKNDDTIELFLLEVKKPDSPETFLRCVLEVMTYYFVINHVFLKYDFKVPQNWTIVPATLIFNCKESKPWKGMTDPKQIHLRELIKKFQDDFGLRMFYFDIDNKIDIISKINSYKIPSAKGFNMVGLANFFKCDVDIEEFHF